MSHPLNHICHWKSVNSDKFRIRYGQKKEKSFDKKNDPKKISLYCSQVVHILDNWSIRNKNLST